MPNRRFRLKALRQAARIGIADADAGRFRSFESPTKLKRHLGSLAQKAISGKDRDRAR